MARDLKKTYVMSCPTYGLWFESFILGMYERMGDEVHQDHMVILELMYKLRKRFAFDYSHSKLSEKKRE